MCRMNLRRIFAIYVRQLFLLRHNPTRFVNIFIWITLDVFLWGFITKYLNSLNTAGFSFVPVLLGAVIFWDFCSRVQQGVMLAFFEDVWSLNFLNLFASPLQVKEYVSGLIATSITTSICGFLVMLLLAGFIFGFNILSLGFFLLFFVVIIFIFGMALGIFAAAIVLRFGPSAEWLAWPIPFVLSPLAGVYYPIATLPVPLQWVSKIIPPSYAFEGIRSVVLTGTASIPQLLTGLALSGMYLLLTYFFFVYIYRFVLRNGLIARFSAETM